MKRTLIIGIAATGLALAGPVAAHHNSICPDCVEENMPDLALEQHTDIVNDVLEMGVAEMAGGSGSGAMSSETNGDTMDPADGPENEVYGGPGSDTGTGTIWTSRDPMIPGDL